MHDVAIDGVTMHQRHAFLLPRLAVDCLATPIPTQFPCGIFSGSTAKHLPSRVAAEVSRAGYLNLLPRGLR
ncbi:hypothetical protein CGRA01v4_06187 [Colletotrichum graminicola]|nr:hypothetical protein CGRA01v4_06187 [Colletotrichum graminicola]